LNIKERFNVEQYHLRIEVTQCFVLEYIVIELVLFGLTLFNEGTYLS